MSKPFIFIFHAHKLPRKGFQGTFYVFNQKLATFRQKQLEYKNIFLMGFMCKSFMYSCFTTDRCYQRSV